MKYNVEIYKDNNDNQLDSFEGQLHVRVGDKFYFSWKEPYNKAIDQYMEENSMFKKEFLNQCIDQKIKECHEKHIMFLKVVKITGSYQKNFNFSILNPEITYCQCITVKEVFDWSDFIHEIKYWLGYYPHGRSRIKEYFKSFKKK